MAVLGKAGGTTPISYLFPAVPIRRTLRDTGSVEKPSFSLGCGINTNPGQLPSYKSLLPVQTNRGFLDSLGDLTPAEYFSMNARKLYFSIGCFTGEGKVTNFTSI